MPSDERLQLRTEHIAWREFDGEGILLDLRTSIYLAANPAATVLWRLLDVGTTRAALVAALMDDFEVDEQRARADVDRFIEDCRRRNLIAGCENE
jgi:hypothetical protein